MGKRQVRIFSRDVAAQLPVLLQKEVNILLKNGTVFHGIIERNQGATLLMKDMLGRKHTLALQDIAEIILDKQTSY